MFNDKSFIDELRQVSSGLTRHILSMKGRGTIFHSFGKATIAVIQDFRQIPFKHSRAEIDYVHGEEHTVKLLIKPAKGDNYAD